MNFCTSRISRLGSNSRRRLTIWSRDSCPEGMHLPGFKPGLCHCRIELSCPCKLQANNKDKTRKTSRMGCGMMLSWALWTSSWAPRSAQLDKH